MRCSWPSSMLLVCDGHGGHERATINPFLDHQRHLRTSFSAPLNLYQASVFKLPQRSALCVGLDAPVLQHKVGNDKGVSLPKPPDMPEREPDQQSFHAKHGSPDTAKKR